MKFTFKEEEFQASFITEYEGNSYDDPSYAVLEECWTKDKVFDRDAAEAAGIPVEDIENDYTETAEFQDRALEGRFQFDEDYYRDR